MPGENDATFGDVMTGIGKGLLGTLMPPLGAYWLNQYEEGRKKAEELDYQQKQQKRIRAAAPSYLKLQHGIELSKEDLDNLSMLQEEDMKILKPLGDKFNSQVALNPEQKGYDKLVENAALNQGRRFGAGEDLPIEAGMPSAGMLVDLLRRNQLVNIPGVQGDITRPGMTYALPSAGQGYQWGPGAKREQIPKTTEPKLYETTEGYQPISKAIGLGKPQTKTGSKTEGEKMKSKFNAFKELMPTFKGTYIDFLRNTSIAGKATDPDTMALGLAGQDLRVQARQRSLADIALEYKDAINILKGKPKGTYKTPEDVRTAWGQGKITEDEALKILRDNFNME